MPGDSDMEIVAETYITKRGCKMPGGNKKGPVGEGAMTGRGMGYCTGHKQAGYLSEGHGSNPRRGRNKQGGGGRAPGRGRGHNGPHHNRV